MGPDPNTISNEALQCQPPPSGRRRHRRRYHLTSAVLLMSAGLLSLFEMRDQGFEAQLLDLRTKILAIALDVAGAFDAHVVRLSPLGCLVHRKVHRDAVSSVARGLRAHGRMVGARINGGRKDLQ